MPNFSYKAVHEFWNRFDDPTIYRVISFMEGVEDWTKDGDPELEAALTRLGEALDKMGEIEVEEKDDIIKLVTFIKTGRGLRLLMALDEAYPGAASKILMHAEDSTQSNNDIPGLMLRRNVVFERLRLLSRVFAPDRIQLMVKTLEESGYD